MRPVNVKSSHWIAYNCLFFIEHFLGEKKYQKLFGNTEKRLYRKIEEHILKNPQLQEDFKVIEHFPGNYPEPYRHPHFPVVYRGLANDWDATKKWGFDFFAEKFGEEDVVLVNNPGMVKKEETVGDYETIKLRDYITNMKNGSKRYLKFSRIVEEKSDLRNDFDNKWLTKFRPKRAANDLFYFFMGGKSTHTPIHNGYAITIFVQLEGTKKWIFYPTSHRLFLGVRPKRFNYFYTDSDPVHDINNQDYPLLKYAKPLEITINPGDVLYFPSMVWHQVENVTDSIGVAYKFADVFAGFNSSKMLATCFFLSTKPYFIDTLLPSRPDVHNYVKKNK